MKRIKSSSDLPNPAHTGAVPDIGPPDENTHPARVRSTPYLPTDVLNRTLALASSGKRASGTFTAKRPTSNVYELHVETSRFFYLPDDVPALIDRPLDRKSANALALTSRPGYLNAESAQSMRHLPGLLGDLKRLRVNAMTIRPDSLGALLQAILPAGDYNRVLLRSITKNDVRPGSP